MTEPTMYDNPIQTGALQDPLVKSKLDDFRGSNSGLNDENLSKNDGRIVQAVLDLYKRSLEHTLVGNQTEEASRMSFAGSFASLGSTTSSIDGGDFPVCMVSYDGSLFGEKTKRGEGDEERFSPISVSAAQMPQLLDRISHISEKSNKEVDEVVWLHSVKGTSIVSQIGSRIGMHPVAMRMFHDVSPQSIVNHLDSQSVVITGVTVYVEGMLLRCQKLVIYAKRGLIVTMERELLGVVGKGAVPLHNKQRLFDLVNQHRLHSNNLWKSLGVGFVIYLLLTELTRQMSSVLDLYARCLAHLQKSVDMRRVTHKIRLKIMRDLHNLQSGLVVLKAYFSNSTAARLKKGHMLGQFGVIKDMHFPYLRDMDESVKWVRSTINAHESAIQEVRENLTVVSDLRVQQVNTTLSLVATIFLPLTFLTGVFGMNFTWHGKYPIGIELLNHEYGALWFWFVCAVFIVFTFFTFYMKGWSETLMHDQLAWG